MVWVSVWCVVFEIDLNLVCLSVWFWVLGVYGECCVVVGGLESWKKKIPTMNSNANCD